MQEIEIVKWIIRVDESKPNGEKADLLGLDKDGNEYRTQYYNGALGDFIYPDIVCTTKLEDE